MPTPRVVVVMFSAPIASGWRPPSPAFGFRPKSTIFTVPAPPGVTIAQFKRESTAMIGFAPVLKNGGRSPPIVVRTHGGVVQGTARLGFGVTKSMMVATFVD